MEVNRSAAPQGCPRHERPMSIPHRVVRFACIAVAIAVASGCRRAQEPERGLATPSLTINHDKVPLGSPIDITYKFVMAPDAPPFDEAYRVFVGVVDADEQLMWTDDHNPPTPTTAWKPNQVITYTRTVFVPIYPYVGDATIHMGLYSMKTQKRLPLNGDNVGAHAYRVATLQLQPQTDNVFTVFRDGWHPAEVAEHNQFVEWQWTKKSATLSFKNPRKNAIFYLDLDNPGGIFNDTQQVQVTIGARTVDQFTLTPKEPVLRKIALTTAQLGSDDLVELHISVDKTFVPALLNASNSKDPRELGVRVFHAFVQPVN
jgi:hypothetical protein